MPQPDLSDALARLRAKGPLIHNITNYVVMNTTANALLAIGASPAMVHALPEVEAFAPLAQALVINIGTLSPPWVAAMARAAGRARALGRPWVLDPVGAGATSYRTRTALELIELRPIVIRGNASEILALAGHSGRTPHDRLRLELWQEVDGELTTVDPMQIVAKGSARAPRVGDPVPLAQQKRYEDDVAPRRRALRVVHR